MEADYFIFTPLGESFLEQAEPIILSGEHWGRRQHGLGILMTSDGDHTG